ncbi:MAG: nucleotide exchange factor GrpE [Oscillospiraceae bacterium]|jgi:molecular chaperone GrpE|nr:nucleotide exchange factor GrpE [Oscillospiraceae bacterium]
MAKKEKPKAAEEEIAQCVGEGEPVLPQNETETKKEASEIEKLNDRLLRTMAEYDNYRKRTAKERIELEADVTARVAVEFLPVLDNLERALQADCTDANYKKGIEMIQNSFLETLKALGVEEIITEGEFNPSYHQAVQKVSDENFGSGEITQTFQKGYKIGEKVIRFAMVAVND